MKSLWRKDKFLLLSLLITISMMTSLFLPLHLPGNPADYENDGTSLVLKYEIYGCGSLIRTVEQGGEALYKKANLDTPASGIYEIKFTSDSDEPEKYLDYEAFYWGEGKESSYFMSVEVVGTDTGAPKCCEIEPAYNETVPLVKVLKWQTTAFVPHIFFMNRHFFTMFALFPIVLLDICLILRYFYRKRRKSKEADDNRH